MRVRVTRAELEAGSPMRAEPCGAPVRLPAGPLRLRTARGPLAVDLLRLRSPAPDPVTAALSPGRVADAGEGRRAGRDGVRLELARPGLLVLGESFSDGWRAYCDGRSLGKPRTVDGYANGWPVKPPCRDVRFAFAPDKPVHWLQVFSALACAALLLVALRSPRRTRDRHAQHADPDAADRAFEYLGGPDPLRGPGVPVRAALLYGLAAGAVLGFCFSLRAGVAIAVGVTAITYFGLRARALVLAAGVLLVIVVPAVYLLFSAEDKGGYNPGYAGEHIGAHWVGVAAYVLLVVALLQVLSRARGASTRAARSRP